TAAQSFQVMTGTSRTGTFATTSLQGVANVYLNPTYNSTDVTLSALATTSATWNGGGGDSKWETAANWSTGSVPTAANDVVIPSGFAAIQFTFSSGNRSVNSITASSPVNVSTNSGITLTLNSASTFSGLTLNGVLSGSGDIHVTGSLNYTGQLMSGTGTTTV